MGGGILILPPLYIQMSNDLFINSHFTSHSGIRLNWKIECDALSNKSIHTLANIISKKYKFGKIYGIPKGGTRLADALNPYRIEHPRILIVDDVFTTGASMEQAWLLFPHTPKVGIVIFARNQTPSWIHPIFNLNIS